MAGSTVANKAGGYWLGTVVFAFIELFFILFIKRQGGTKSETGCVGLAESCGRSTAFCAALRRANPSHTLRCDAVAAPHTAACASRSPQTRAAAGLASCPALGSLGPLF